MIPCHKIRHESVDIPLEVLDVSYFRPWIPTTKLLRPRREKWHIVLNGTGFEVKSKLQDKSPTASEHCSSLTHMVTLRNRDIKENIVFSKIEPPFFQIVGPLMFGPLLKRLFAEIEREPASTYQWLIIDSTTAIAPFAIVFSMRPVVIEYSRFRV